MTARTVDPLVVLDDGHYYIELNVNFQDEASAPGFLQRRCYVGVTTPGGYECIGNFERQPSGKWRASIDMVYDPRTGSDSKTLGSFGQRMDAIVALWGARRSAYCRHAAG